MRRTVLTLSAEFRVLSTASTPSNVVNRRERRNHIVDGGEKRHPHYLAILWSLFLGAAHFNCPVVSHDAERAGRQLCSKNSAPHRFRSLAPTTMVKATAARAPVGCRRLGDRALEAGAGTRPGRDAAPERRERACAYRRRPFALAQTAPEDDDEDDLCRNDARAVHVRHWRTGGPFSMHCFRKQLELHEGRDRSKARTGRRCAGEAG